MPAVDWAAVSFGVAAIVLWLIIREVRRPRFLVTVQKATNVNQQPETVTVQANVRSGSIKSLFDVMDRAATACVARMQTINEEILAETAKSQAAMQQRVAAHRSERDKVVTERRRRKIARKLGLDISEVSDAMIAEKVAQARGLASVPAQEAQA